MKRLLKRSFLDYKNKGFYGALQMVEKHIAFTQNQWLRPTE